MKFGLENMRVLCEALGHPERSFTPVIVGGTNGKGSVTAIVAAALTAAGHRTGRYTSPHLERVEERFNIDGADVTTPALSEAAATAQAAVEKLLETGALGAPVTFFECTTAIAFELFRRAQVEVGVLEVGLGGRLDATNVVNPIAAAITSIDFDHQAQLGNTIESIAFEKAGIIKPGIPVVCGPVPPAAERVIREACAERGATFIRAEDQVRSEVHVAPQGTTASFVTGGRSFDDVRLALPGRHQATNAATAICLLDVLSALGVRVDDTAIRGALASTTWPARLERRTLDGSDVVVDAAHNPAGARSLAAYLREIEWSQVALVFGAMRDKDVAGILEPLLPCCASVVCTTPETPRAMPAPELAALVRTLAPADVRIDAIDPPEAAMRVAAASNTRVVAAGSIFLVGPLRGILR